MEHQTDQAAKPSTMFVAVVVLIAILIPVLIVASLALGFQPSLGKGPPAGAGAAVVIPVGAGNPDGTVNYEPGTVTVVVGVNNTLSWKEDDPIPHTVTSVSVPDGAKAFDSLNLNKGDSFTVTLDVPGTYTYHCTYHAWMKGTVIVNKA